MNSVYEFHIFELRDREINAGKVIIVQYATYVAPERRPFLGFFFGNCMSCVFNCDDLLFF